MKETRDILTLFEALSNHEVFTPPRTARELLDMLPSGVWSDPNLRFLDPCAKSGVFLRECFFKLEEGLKGKGVFKAIDGIDYDLNDFKQRTRHILKNMLFGIAISELTGYVSRRTLYGVMEANTDKQLAAIESFEKSKNFDDWTEEEKWNFIGRNKFNEYYDHKMFSTADYVGLELEGNIFYPKDEVQKLVLEEGNFIVEDAYFPFIDERTEHKKILDIRNGKMRFDVICGNPPYQTSDSGHGRSAKPIYNQFVEMAKSMNPRYITMIMPSRWFAGGKGLNSFRADMLADKRLAKIVDFENSTDVFPGVDVAGGVCYFLWDRTHKGKCEVVNKTKKEEYSELRDLNEFHVFVRNSRALSIVKKVLAKENNFLNSVISARNPYGVTSTDKPAKSGIPCYFTQKIGRQFIKPHQIRDNNGYKDKWKVLFPYAPIAGQTDFSKPIKFYHSKNVIISKPGEVSTETYLVAHAFDSKEEAENFKSYLFTKTFRFLLLQNVVSQHITRECFFFVPELTDYKSSITDAQLRERWEITDSEWAVINDRIQDTE